jgi:beta-galactosidase
MRTVYPLNENWKFVKKEESLDSARKEEGENVTVPFTWNAKDGQDGKNDYVRGAFWFLKETERPELKEGQELWLEFKGVNSSAEVYVNSKKVGAHDGGYSAFRFNVTSEMKEGMNEIAVLVDNKPNERVYPQTADFTFYGGIYRDVNLIRVEKNHFELGYFGTPGIKCDTSVEGKDGVLTVSAWEKLPENTEISVFNKDGNKVASGKGNEKIVIQDVHLWNGVKDPYLYEVKAQARDGENVSDEVDAKIGFRSFEVNPRKGFYLNGKAYPLHGVAKHQDRLGVGNAVTKDMMKEDALLIREVGATTVRLAHYQHDDYTYSCMDELGIVVWSEIPYISRHMQDGRDNAISQMKELIVQTYNHPSIVCRGLSNEITMKPSKGKTKAHKELKALVKKMDPSRFTVMANFAMMMACNPFCHLPDATSMNFYHGWYTPFTWLNGFRLSFFHLLFPHKPLGFSEYGADGMPNLHSEHPKRGDDTEEYQYLCLYKIYKSLEKRPYLWATHLWNMFDFGADGRNVGGVPGQNHKGLITFDRKTKKDSFYLYKGFWSDEPFVHIASKRFKNRCADSIMIYVMSNQDEVELFVNGKSAGVQKGHKVLFGFKVPLTGDLKVEARSGDCLDSAEFRKVSSPDPSYKLSTKSNNASWEK